MSDPVADAHRAADAARAGVRRYEDALMAEADRQKRLDLFEEEATAISTAELAQRFPAMRSRLGLPGGGAQ